jgi:hypothetical protein
VKAFILILAALCIVGSCYAWDDQFTPPQTYRYCITWDDRSDTTFGIIGSTAVTGHSGVHSDTSQPFLVAPDMSLMLVFNDGATTDSIQIYPEMWFSPLGGKDLDEGAPTTGFTNTVAGVDSIGYILTADSTANTTAVDCSTTIPERWARLYLAALTKCRISAQVTGQAYVLRHK